MAAKPQRTPPDAPPEEFDDIDDTSTPPPSVAPDKSAKNANKNKGEKCGKGGIIFFVIMLLLVGAAVVVLAFDIGGFREDVVMPYLRNAPLIGGFFPDPEEDPLAEMTPEEVRAEHDRLLHENEGQEARIRQLEQQLAERDFRIADYVRYYNYWSEFRTAQAQLGQVLAHHDPQMFLAFLMQHHNLIDVEHIPQLIQDASRAAEFDDEIREMVRTFGNMDESSAGEILEHWMITDLSMMIRVLRAMSAQMRGEIMDTLEGNVAANMLLMMTQQPPQFTPIVPNLRELPAIETVPVLPPVVEPETEDYEDEDYYYEEDEYEETEDDEVDEPEDEPEDEVEPDEVDE
jgi:hypothetical protein